ncbi:MAG: DUF503 family protein [Anaerolineaceae bacterium]|jgi:uncharacterized protein YlxP (DUF503 family)|nr:DUF503 family protein [Anaerolineaceae bacterium]MDD4042054.1 DUF503 family protein [Anaerolineaceae bacterium]MDD4578032.1 DUF503 family protein [Anaerolineaceae bacterium]
MPFAYCHLKLKIDRCESLKEKRSILTALLTRLKKYNLSVIEKANQDNHHLIELEMSMVRPSIVLLDKDLESVSDMIERAFPNLNLFAFEKEIYI